MRVQGLLFQWSFGRRLKEEDGYNQYDDFKELRAIKYDRSFPAFNYSKWEVRSLGLKTQFLKMRPYNRDQMGPDALLFGLEISHPQAMEIANRVPLSDMTLGNTREEIDTIKDRIIGETFSLIYFPFGNWKCLLSQKKKRAITSRRYTRFTDHTALQKKRIFPKERSASLSLRFEHPMYRL